MTRISQDIEFDRPAPKQELIIKKVSEYSGLPVVILSSYPDEINDMDITIAFKDFPKDILEISSYRPGAIRKIIRQEKKDFAPLKSPHDDIHGSKERKGKQNISIDAYAGQELSLFIATERVLLELGGKPVSYNGEYQTDEINPELEEKYSFPIDVAELEKRHQANIKQNKKNQYMNYLMLPISIPITIVCLIIDIVKFPYTLFKSLRDVGIISGKKSDK